MDLYHNNEVKFKTKFLEKVENLKKCLEFFQKTQYDSNYSISDRLSDKTIEFIKILILPQSLFI